MCSPLIPCDVLSQTDNQSPQSYKESVRVSPSLRKCPQYCPMCLSFHIVHNFLSCIELYFFPRVNVDKFGALVCVCLSSCELGLGEGRCLQWMVGVNRMWVGFKKVWDGGYLSQHVFFLFLFFPTVSHVLLFPLCAGSRLPCPFLNLHWQRNANHFLNFFISFVFF